MARDATKVKKKDQLLDNPPVLAPKGEKRGKGRGFPYEPNEADRTIVKLCCFVGLSQEETARLLDNGRGVSATCLRDHYRNEWEVGKSQMLAKVAATLYGIATNPRHPQAASSCIFILKSQARWRTTDPTTVEAKIEKPSGEDAPMTFTLKIGERDGDEH